MPYGPQIVVTADVDVVAGEHDPAAGFSSQQSDGSKTVIRMCEG